MPLRPTAATVGVWDVLGPFKLRSSGSTDLIVASNSRRVADCSLTW